MAYCELQELHGVLEICFSYNLMVLFTKHLHILLASWMLWMLQNWTICKLPPFLHLGPLHIVCPEILFLLMEQSVYAMKIQNK